MFSDFLQVFKRLIYILFIAEIVTVKLNHGGVVIAVGFQGIKQLFEIIISFAGSEAIVLCRTVTEMNLSNLIPEQINEFKFVFICPAALLYVQHRFEIIADEVGNLFHIVRIGAKAIIYIFVCDKNA